MELYEAKKQMRVFYNNGDISDDAYKVFKSIVKEYEKRIYGLRDDLKANVWSNCDEKLLIHMYNHGRCMDEMMDALGRSSRAIDKRINFLKKKNIIK